MSRVRNDLDSADANRAHAKMVKSLAKPGGIIADDLDNNPEAYKQLMATVRTIIRAGTTLDYAKKQAIYNKATKGSAYFGQYEETTPLEASQAHLLHMAIGIVGEASELLEAVVKHIDGERLDVENCLEESGDIEFYHEGFRQALGFSRVKALNHNVHKLVGGDKPRYEGGEYSDQAAQTRADKA